MVALASMLTYWSLPPDTWTAPERCQWSQCLSVAASSAESFSAPYLTSSPEISPMFNVLMRAKHTNRWEFKTQIMFYRPRGSCLSTNHDWAFLPNSKWEDFGENAIWANSIKFTQTQIINNLCNILAKQMTHILQWFCPIIHSNVNQIFSSFHYKKMEVCNKSEDFPVFQLMSKIIISY